METMWKRVLSFVLVLALLMPNFATIAAATEEDVLPTEEVISAEVLSEEEEETPEEEPEVIAEETEEEIPEESEEVIPEESEEAVPEESEEVVPEESEEVIPEESEEVIPEESEEVIPEESEEVIPEESEEVIPEESEEAIPEASEEVIPEESQEIVLGSEVTIEETMEVVDSVVEETEAGEEPEVNLELSLMLEEESLSEDLTNDEMLDGYVRQILMDEDTSAYGVQGYNRLDVYGKYAYDQMKAVVQAVAENGNEGSTKITFTGEDLLNAGYDVLWSAEDLGVSALFELNEAERKYYLTAEADAAMEEKLSDILPMSEVLHALRTDYPYEMYWWGNGWKTGAKNLMISQNSETDEIEAVGYATVFVELSAAVQYKTNGVFDAGKITELQTTLDTVKETAADIVKQYEDATDYDKLQGYKEEICKLTEYNDAAADKSESYFKGTSSNPWQLLYVFDGDDSTNVVCEGYSKAFQYLYDLTYKAEGFDGEVYSYLVTGGIPEGHMWNIVDFYGKNYLVDVTNSDDDTIGSDGGLFMVGGDGSVEEGYSYVFHAGEEYEQTIAYTYDEGLEDELGSVLTLSTSNPGQAQLEAALMRCAVMNQADDTVGYWYEVLDRNVIVTDDMTLYATLHVGDGPNDQTKVEPVTLTVADGATLYVPEGLELENNDTIVIENGAIITGKGTYSGNDIVVEDGGSLTLPRASTGETETTLGQLGFLWPEWKGSQMYIGENPEPDMHGVYWVPGNIFCGVFYYAYEENGESKIAPVPFEELSSSNENAVKLEAVSEAEVDGDAGVFARVFMVGDWGDYSVISYTDDSGKTHEMRIDLKMTEDVFLSAANRSEDNHITSFEMHPLKENVFYFNFSSEVWSVVDTEESSPTPMIPNVQTGEYEKTDRITVEQVGNSGIYKITLTKDFVKYAFTEGDFEFQLQYVVTDGEDTDTRTAGIYCYRANLWECDAGFELNGQPLFYYAEYDGFMGPDMSVEGNDKPLIEQTLPENVTYNHATKTLKLSGAELTGLQASKNNISELNILLSGENTIISEHGPAMLLHDGIKLSIMGDPETTEDDYLTLRNPNAQTQEDGPVVGLWSNSTLIIEDGADVTVVGKEEVDGNHICGITGNSGTLIMNGGVLAALNGEMLDDPEGNVLDGNYCGICGSVASIQLYGGELVTNNINRSGMTELIIEGGSLLAPYVRLESPPTLNYGELYSSHIDLYTYLPIGGSGAVDENGAYKTMTVNVCSDQDGPVVNAMGYLHLMAGADVTIVHENPTQEGNIGLYSTGGASIQEGTLTAEGDCGILFAPQHQGVEYSMNGGTVNAVGEHVGLHMNVGKLNVYRGTLNASAEGDACMDEEGNPVHTFGVLLDNGAQMTIAGGQDHTFSATDADNNGDDSMSKALGIRNGATATINGGKLTLDADMALYNPVDRDVTTSDLLGSYSIVDKDGTALTLKKDTYDIFTLMAKDEYDQEYYVPYAVISANWADSGVQWELVQTGGADTADDTGDDTYTLKISGQGELYNYTVDANGNPETPWHLALTEGNTAYNGVTIDAITAVEVGLGEGDSITKVGSNAFSVMPNVAKIILPNSLDELDAGFAFRNPAAFEIQNDETGRYYVDSYGVIIDRGTTEDPGIMVLRAPTGFKGEYKPPAGTTIIGMSSFEGITGLTAIDLTGIEYIAGGAFASAGLKTVVIPEGVTYISNGAFNGTRLDSLTLPASLKEVWSFAFDSYEIKQLHYNGSAAQWGAVTIEDANAALMAAIPTMTFGATEKKDREEDAYLSITRLNNDGQGWYEPEDKHFEEELHMPRETAYYGMVYLNTWVCTSTDENGDEWGGWLSTPLKAIELGSSGNAGLEILNLAAAQEWIANGQTNVAYFMRIIPNGDWSAEGAITYEHNDQTLEIPVYVHRDGFDYYDESVLDNWEDEDTKNNAWTDAVGYDPFAEVGATFYAMVDFDRVATGLPHVVNEEFQDQNWTRISYWNGTEFKAANTWVTGSTTAKLFKIEILSGAPASPFYLHMDVDVKQVNEDGSDHLDENGNVVKDTWGKGIDVSIVTGGQDNPWYGGFELDGLYYDVFKNGAQISDYSGNSWIGELPEGVDFKWERNEETYEETSTLTLTNAQLEKLAASLEWHDEHTGDSGWNLRTDTLIINLVGESSIYNGTDHALRFSDNLKVIITSDSGGVLNVEAKNSPYNENEDGQPYAFDAFVVESGASVTIGGNATVNAKIAGQGYWEENNPAQASAIQMRGNDLTLTDNATLNTIVPTYGRTENGWYEDNGDFVGGWNEIVDFGQLLVEGNATLNTGRINVPAIWEYDEESDSDYYTGRSGTFIMNGGTVNIEPTSNRNVWDDGTVEYWFNGIQNDRGTIRINGGKLNIEAPLYHNPEVADGSVNSFVGINMDGGTMTVNGGKVIVNGTELNDGGWEQNGDIENACGLRLGYGDYDNGTYPASVTVNNGFVFLGTDGENADEERSSSISHDAHSGTFTVNGGTVIARGDAHFEGRLKQTGGELEINSSNVSFNNMVQAQGGEMRLNSWQVRLNDMARLRIENDAKVRTAAWNYNSTDWMEHFTVESNAYVEVKGGLLEVVCENFSVGLMMKGEFLQTGGVVDIRIENNRDDSEEIHGDYFEQAVFATGLMQLDGGKMNLNQIDTDMDNAYVPTMGYHQAYEQGEPQWNVLENPDGKLVVNGGTLNVAGSQGGILLESAMEINGGEVNATVTTENEGSAAVGVYDFGLDKTSLTITGGTLNANGTIVGMHIQAPVKITGGSVNATITTDLNKAAAVLIENNDNKASLTITGGEHTFTAPIPVDGGNAYMSKGLLVDDAPVVVEAADGETVTVLIQAECTVAEFTWDTTESKLSGNELIFTSLMDGVSADNATRTLQWRDVTNELEFKDGTVFMHYLDENQGSGKIIYNTHVRIGDEPVVVKPNEAAIGSQEYATLADAINNANEGDFINIIADITETPDVTVNKALTILNFYGFKLWDDDPASALDMIMGEGYGVTVNGVIYFINKLPETKAPVAKIGGTEYTTVKAALEAAVSGDTVVMIADSDEASSDLVVNAGVTLYLDTFDLAAKSVVGHNGSYVYGQSYHATDDDCLLITDSLRLSEKAPVVKDGTIDYNVIPMYDPNQNGYVFAYFNVYTDHSFYGLTINEEAQELGFKFNQQTKTVIRTGLLGEKYSAVGNKFRVVLRLSWESAAKDGTYIQNFEYKDDFVKKCTASSGNYYGYVLKGYELFGLNEETMDSLKVQAMVITDCGVVSAGKVFVAPNH